MIIGLYFLLSLLCVIGLAVLATEAGDGRLDLTQAVVVTPPDLSDQEAKAVMMLVEEVEKRARLRWPIVTSWPSDGAPVIAVGRAEALAALSPYAAERLGEAVEPGREGYRLQIARNRDTSVVLIAGQDARGVLFGVGRLLRTLRMERDRVTVPTGVNLVSAPRYPLRGHQLGYRPKTNSYDAWTLPLWEQYFRDLAVFGANAVELVPPRTDDDADSPHFPLPPMEMMVGMSRLLDDYGLDVWVWFPAMDSDYIDPTTVASALEEWSEVFAKLPRLDAVFVPGGDPGHTPPKILMAFLEKATAELQRYHPQAGMWVSPQGFTQVWLDEFLEILQKERPSWLAGVVFGPQVRVSLPTLRALVPEQYPIRHYPDITHTRQCQYPVPDWDVAFALTEGREGINPRPMAQAHIFRQLQSHTLGFLTYSEGCNDDVNKTVWSALGWEPEADGIEILREYGRYFISDRYADAFAQGLLALERNWQGPLATNEGILTTLQQFQAMEREATPQERLNWRFQQALYRAYYDATLQSRLRYENELEARAMERLRAAGQIGALAAIEEAEDFLDRALTQPVALDWRARVFELAEALFQSIRMQLSVERYQAIAVERGANLDSIDAPLNNRIWLKRRFETIGDLTEEAKRLREIEALVHWTDPGPGGFYDEPGNPTRPSRLVRATETEEDPGCYASMRVGFATGNTGRIAWSRHIETLYDTPLQMRYTDLDPEAIYRIRVTYAGDSPTHPIRLVAGENIEIHPPIPKPVPTQPLEFALPAGAIVNGELLLTWTGEKGRGGNGRGCQVSEVWLLRVLFETGLQVV